MSFRAGVEEMRNEVIQRFGVDPGSVRVVASPYRVCPLGAHVDHQLGQVTGMTIDQGVILAYAPAGDRCVRLVSRDFPGEVSFSLDAVPGRREGEWGNYPRGAVRALQERFPLERGIMGLTSGRLAEGGLSSSAAIGVAYLLALEEANGIQVSARDNILLDQAIENDYLGLRNGILDQATILLSKRGFLTHIHCSDGSHSLIPPAAHMPSYALVIAFSGLQQALVSTDYNLRVDECATAARTLLDACGRTAAPALLGHVTRAEYLEHTDALTGAPARRAAHFFAETERVEQGVEAWRAGDLDRFGALITASGSSSIHQYECGCEPLIDLYDILTNTPGVYGARFSGAGFRGCCVAMVRADAAAAIVHQVREAYQAAQPQLAAKAPVLVCAPGHGAGHV